MRPSSRTLLLTGRRALLQAASETGTSSSSTNSSRSLSAAATAKPANPAPGSPTAQAQAAIKSGQQPAASITPANSTSGAGGGGDGGGGGGGGGGGWFLPTLTLAGAGGGGYYYYTTTQQQQKQTGATSADSSSSSSFIPQLSREQLDATQKAALNLLNKSKEKVQELLPPMLGGTAGSKQQGSTAATAPKTSSSSAADRLAEQKRRDAEEAGFKMLPPGSSEDATATAAAADAAAAASAAARDSLSAAADEFPGSTPAGSSSSPAGAAAVVDVLGEVVGNSSLVDQLEHVDLTPIADLFADVTGVHSTTTATTPAASTTTSSSKASSAAAATGTKAAPADDSAAHRLAEGLHKMQASAASALSTAAGKLQQHETTAAGAGDAGAGGGGGAAAKVASSAHSEQQPQALRAVEDSELQRLCEKLGLAEDLAPSGLVSAANRAGLGAVNSSGAHLPPQMAQLNQATADARILGEVLQLAAANTAKLRQQLEEARQHAAWAEAAAEKRESSLTSHFKELMREQSRIHQELTEAAVKEAQQVVIADTAKAHLQERQERLALTDSLRDKVNALAVAFDQRTAQLRSAQDVNKVSIGMLSLSRALEEGAPIGPQLQHLAAACPDDPLVEAVAASLPPSAASQGLPTLQELRDRFVDVSQAAAEAAYFVGLQEGAGAAQGGVLAHLAAKLAAKLKVDAGPDVDNSVDSKLSQARKLLQQGQLRAAAEVLSSAAEGSQAAGVVQQWVADAQARAAADQAVKLLQAHATATAGLAS